MKKWWGAVALVVWATVGGAAQAALRVCADPGNLPLSNNRGEGFENRIAALLATSMGTSVQYYFRPSIERGLTRTTLYADECDLMMDMPLDSERVLTTEAIYRTTFVLAYRNDKGLAFKSLDDPKLKKLKVGVYQTSAIREALSEHDVSENVVIHYLTHDADLVPEDQPSYQVQEVIDGKLDVAAVWGPFAGYYKALKHAPLTIQPVNLMEDAVPMEYDMAFAVRTTDKTLKAQLDQAIHKERDGIRAILVDYGVPLVKCDTCLIAGDLPSHGPYKEEKPHHGDPTPSIVSIATLNDWLAHGASVNEELNHAIIADDLKRIRYLVEKKHADVNAPDLQGETPLDNAIRKASLALVTYLVEHGADVNGQDHDGWTPVMTAAWLDDAGIIHYLVSHKADPNGKSAAGLTPLAIASQNGKDVAAVALIEDHADANQTVGGGGYTPLMLAVAGHSMATTKALVDHGANVNAKNEGGITALMIAAAADQAPLVALLVKAGADVGARDEKGETALSIARDKDGQAVIKLLEQAPASAVPSSGSSGA
ncbi:MAG TPA: quinoprotein dehydrogenase-associated putative ABC transporter substrate-binding protein [Steroidobacteraceae bacterium]|jgi:quinoprotein dehydrogenase-associated probable ABC transporter substrate-binding protein|nr:quinoprotein dehydrogenase-associated putative ABC transporter substrate-binding protein [Steroidobacteraceae bacterium]